jgi:phospholipid/cholesterol/gamma-HCH transport system permease protein
LFSALRDRIIPFFEFFGQLSLLHLQVWSALVRGHIGWKNTVKQAADMGLGTLPIAVITVAFSGAVLAYHIADTAARWGMGGVVGWGVAESIAREMGPVLVAVVVAARAGSAMAAELGTMKVTEQVDALRAMAVDPVEYLVVPRYLAGVFMVPVLTFVGDFVGVVGGYLMVLASPDINEASYFASIPGNLEYWTVIAGLIKSVVFGVLVVLIGCHQGLTCRMDSEEVGRATTRSVVYAIVLIYAFDLAMTALLYPV